MMSAEESTEHDCGTLSYSCTPVVRVYRQIPMRTSRTTLLSVNKHAAEGVWAVGAQPTEEPPVLRLNRTHCRRQLEEPPSTCAQFCTWFLHPNIWTNYPNLLPFRIMISSVIDAQPAAIRGEPHCTAGTLIVSAVYRSTTALVLLHNTRTYDSLQTLHTFSYDAPPWGPGVFFFLEHQKQWHELHDDRHGHKPHKATSASSRSAVQWQYFLFYGMYALMYTMTVFFFTAGCCGSEPFGWYVDVSSRKVCMKAFFSQYHIHTKYVRSIILVYYTDISLYTDCTITWLISAVLYSYIYTPSTNIAPKCFLR